MASTRYQFDTGPHIGIVQEVKDDHLYVELKDGTLVYVPENEMRWSNQPISPDQFFRPGQRVRLTTEPPDPGETVLTGSIRNAEKHPWPEFKRKYHKGNRLAARITLVTTKGALALVDMGIKG
jgi:ribosomal protein S1